MSAPRLQALTGARFVAAFVVVLYHLWRPAWTGPVVGPVGDVVAHGALSVSFFFVLSGFVLGWSLSHGAIDDVTVDAGAFWRRRARRLLPMFFASVLVALPVAVALARRAVQAAVAAGLDGSDAPTVASVLGPELIAHLSLMQAWWPGKELVINAPAWSLSAEVAFSLALPFLWRPLWRGAGRSPFALLGVLWIASTLPGIVYVVVDGDGLQRLGLGLDHRAHALWLDVLRYHPLVRAPEFFAGVVVARAVRDGRVSIPRADVAVVVALAALLGVVVALQGAFGGAATVITHNGLFLPVFVVVIVTLATAPSAALVARLLSSRPLVALGDASYALYLLHVPLLYWASGLAERRGRPGLLDTPAAAAIVVVVIVGLSVLAHRLVERRR